MATPDTANIFAIAEQCLFSAEIDHKLQLTLQARQFLRAGVLDTRDNGRVRPISATLFPDRPQWLQPRDMPRRGLDGDAGKAAFFHALAHIEFVAIYLAWDILYRFRGLPEAFYWDWLCIAAEEAEHFMLLREQMQRYAADYGDLPAHGGLWLYAQETAGDVLARLAIVPRCMEARGLDVTPGMIERLRQGGDSAGVAVLQRIYQDEIGHVERGSFWFQYLARRQGDDPEQKYRELLKTYFQGKPKGPFNREMRIIAGFTHQEIDWLEAGCHD